MNETSPEIDSSSRQIGFVTEISGFRLSCQLVGGSAINGNFLPHETAQIGALIKIPTPSTIAFGFIDNVAYAPSLADTEGNDNARVEVDLLGEIRINGNPAEQAFVRGITVYPLLGAAVFEASGDDMTLIYAKSNAAALAVGSLHQYPENTAYLKSEVFFAKHSAIIGTTGAGKSCALVIILRSLLAVHPHGHILLLDPHGEYGPAFPDMAENITPDSLRLPYWLFGFDEIAEVVCSKEPNARSREILILKEAILYAKRDFLGDKSVEFTVDTPIPYLIDDVVRHVSDEMGKLLKADTSQPYLRLMSTIEGLVRDRRYRFMFAKDLVHDDMADILGRILRIPVNGRPITVLDISAVPSEINNVVVSLICRLVFDFAVRADREDTIPIMVACDEAHRYIPRDDAPGFDSARQSIGRIAQEGRKYGVSLCLITQRPSELSEAILSQCNTIIALRISNEEDKKFVRNHLPDAAGGLLNMLPTLGQQEAILVGEGAVHPMRIRFNDLAEPYRPRLAPTNFPFAWDKDTNDRTHLKEIIKRWRDG